MQDVKQGVDVDMRRAVDTPDGVSGGKDSGSRCYGVGGTGSPLAEEDEYAESWETWEKAKERLRAPTTRQGVVPVQMGC